MDIDEQAAEPAGAQIVAGGHVLAAARKDSLAALPDERALPTGALLAAAASGLMSARPPGFAGVDSRGIAGLDALTKDLIAGLMPSIGEDMSAHAWLKTSGIGGPSVVGAGLAALARGNDPMRASPWPVPDVPGAFKLAGKVPFAALDAADEIRIGSQGLAAMNVTGAAREHTLAFAKLFAGQPVAGWGSAEALAAAAGIGSVVKTRVSFSESALSQYNSTCAVRDVLRLANPEGLSAGLKTSDMFDGLTVSVMEKLHGRAELNAGLALLNTGLLGDRVAFATRPAIAYESYVGSLLEHPSRRGGWFAQTSGVGLTGLVAADTLHAPRAKMRDEVLERVEHEVLQPWAKAGVDARHDLYARLDALLGGGIGELLQGAWDSVAHQGPGQIVKIASCSVEALDRSLRSGAPEADVMRWVSETPDAEKTLDMGRPTRNTRVRYITRNRKGEHKVIEAQVQALVTSVNETNRRLQAAKHASNGSTAQVRTHLMTAEAILSMLFGDD